MASNSLSLLSPAFLLLLSISLSFLILPTSSTSRRTLVHHEKISATSSGFRVELRRVDHGKNLTKFERLQRGIKRGKHRLQRLNAMVLASKTDDSSAVKTPVKAGNGEFLMKLSVGTPPESFSAIMDTGSDLIWTQCLPCSNCFDQSTPIFDPKKSSSFSKLPCSSSLCEALPSSTCSDGCEYFYAYGDYSSTEGVLASETFSFGDGSVKGIGFGCGGDNEGDGFAQGAGLVGLGRGPLSLVSQLKEPKFSYCLTSMADDSKTSSLLMGSLATKMGGKNDTSFEEKTTPLIKNPSQPSFYYLSLEGISVGGKLLDIEKDTFSIKEDGSGGLIIDSGTTITYLEHKGFDVLKKEFVSQMKGILSVDNSGSQAMDLCFNLPKGTETVQVPKLVFHFKGADLELPPENYILSDSDLGVLCLAMGASSGMSIFGNIQQQNLLVVHDLENERLSFVPTQCDEL